MRNRLLITVGVALCAALTTPSLAAAHTGSVTCTTAGVQFAYAANFAHDTLVTENVGGAVRGVTVKAHTASTDTWPGVTGMITAGATWKDGDASGSIPTTTLTCPAKPTPAPPAESTCPEGTTMESSAPGVIVCVRTITNTVAVSVPAPVLPAVHDIVYRTVKVPAKQGKCPRYTRRMSKLGRPLVCGKDVIRWRTPKDTPRRTPIHRDAGVTG